MTNSFKTKSEILERKMPRILGNNQWAKKTIIALDGGYSSVKGMSANTTFIFPSFAKKIPEGSQIIGSLNPDDIHFRDNKTGILWAIGSLAENLMDSNDLTTITDESLFTRYRYSSEIFHAIMGAGLGIGLIGTGEIDEIYLSTGLPSGYKNEDEEELKEALAGDYDISIRIGNKPFEDFKFTLKKDHIMVMEQPQGTLMGIIYDKNGNLIPSRKDLMSQNTIIYDIGFDTEDIFAIRGGRSVKKAYPTYTDTAMKAVFEETIKELKAQYAQVSCKVFEFQKALARGCITKFNRQTLSTEEIPFEDILMKKNAELCDKSVRRLLEDYDNLLDYKNLVVTGGTGESRFEQIYQMLKGIQNLTIIRGNDGDTTLPFSYSNVRGYYMVQYLQLLRASKAEGRE